MKFIALFLSLGLLVGCGEEVCVLGVGDCEETGTELRISAEAASVAAGDTLKFSATGGLEPRIFTIIASNPVDAGSINPTSGLYTAGSDTGVVCIRVTDANNAHEDLCITVTGSGSRRNLPQGSPPDFPSDGPPQPAAPPY